MALLLSGFTLGTLFGAVMGWIHRDKSARKFQREATDQLLYVNEQYADLIAFVNNSKLRRVK